MSRRRTSLRVVVPALLLFGLTLLGASLSFAGNLGHPTTAVRWVGSSVWLLVSSALVLALLREVVLGFRDGPERPIGAAPVPGEARAPVLRWDLPTDETWARFAPAWAKHRRTELLEDLTQWCTAQGIPLTVDERAWVVVPRTRPE